MHVYVGRIVRWTQQCDLHESAGWCNYQQSKQSLPNIYWHQFKKEAPHSADWSLTPLFARSQRTRETFSLRGLSMFSQHEEKEDRD